MILNGQMVACLADPFALRVRVRVRVRVSCLADPFCLEVPYPTIELTLYYPIRVRVRVRP